MKLDGLTAALAGIVMGLGSMTAAAAADPESCQTVRMSDPGWTDITSTNAILGVLLEGLGYEQNVDTLAVPVTFESLKNGELDAFLGNWMPAQTRFVEPLVQEQAIEVVGRNLDQIRFTLAVPKAVAEAGVKDFKDLAAHADKFDQKIYGIEPGAPANQNIQKMIDAGEFGLGDWEVVESSEQAMLSQVDRRTRSGDWIVFLAWEPHPMNTKFPLEYLSGGDAYFGANYGAATVYTITRKGYAAECPNVGKLLGNLKFTVDMENQVMGGILDEGEDAQDAATKLIKAQPQLLETWLAGVTTAEGEDGLAAVRQSLGL
jgi:glycine betaine/proline transport system substrate-binding protein